MTVEADHPVDVAQPGESAHAHFPCFDGLRAMAALFVVMHHSGFATGYSVNGRFGEFLAHGDSGVSIFFLISGFLLYRPFVNAHLSGRAPMDAVKFWWRRALRIFPAYWIALIGIYFIFGFQKGALHTPGDFLAYFGLTQIYDTTRFFYGVNQSWSIATELSFYLFIPFYALAIRRIAARRPERRVRVEALGLVSLVVVCVVWRLAWYAYDPFWQRLGPGFRAGRQAPFAALATLYWLPTHFDLFALGMGLALVSVWASRREVVPAFLQWVGRNPVLCWAMAGLCYWIVCTRVGLPRNLVTLTGGQYFVRQTLYGLMAFFLLLPAVFGDQSKSLIRRTLRWGPIAYIGLVSYGVYLWHQAWLGYIRTHWLGPQHAFSGPLVPLVVITLAYTLLTASLSYFLIERPLLRFKDRLPWRRADRPPAVTAR